MAAHSSNCAGVYAPRVLKMSNSLPSDASSALRAAASCLRSFHRRPGALVFERRLAEMKPFNGAVSTMRTVSSRKVALDKWPARRIRRV